jgi:hypothetical protein
MESPRENRRKTGVPEASAGTTPPALTGMFDIPIPRIIARSECGMQSAGKKNRKSAFAENSER